MTDSELLQRPTLRPDEVARILRMSRNGVYEAINRGDIPSIRIGSRIVIPGEPFRRTLGIEEIKKGTY